MVIVSKLTRIIAIDSTATLIWHSGRFKINAIVKFTMEIQKITYKVSVHNALLEDAGAAIGT